MLTNLKVDKDNDRITLKYNGNEYTRQFNKIDQAVFDKTLDCIFLLSPSFPQPNKLHVLNSYGEDIAEIPSPDGASFYYLTTKNDNEVIIVCTFSDKVDGWYDWHYFYDNIKKKITREAPAF